MRLEFSIEMSEIDTPRFAVEAVEGIGKLFTLATLVLNTLDIKDKVEIVFHGLNPEDPERRINAFKQICESCNGGTSTTFVAGASGQVKGSSSSFQWLQVSRSRSS
jgi:hypothetical protein